MSGLPEGWEDATLGDLLSIRHGFAFKSNEFCDQGIPVIRQTNLTGDDIDLSKVVYLPSACADEYARFLIKKGDILLGMSGSIGEPTVYLLDKPALQNQRVGLLEFNIEDDALKNFCRLFLVYSQEALARKGKGLAVQNVSASDIESLPISCPPLFEQRRIVAKLQTLFERARRAREELTHIPHLIENYKKAILDAAFRGDLTKDWRDAHDVLVESWDIRTLDILLTGIRAGKNLRCEERPPREHERGVVKVSAVTWGTFDKSQAKTLPASFNPSSDTLIRSGDFLFSRANTIDLVGACVIVEDVPENLYLSDKVLRLDMPNAAKPWVLWFLRCRQGRELLENASTGNQLSMRNVSQSALRAIACPWPTEPETHEILRRIESSMQAIERIKSEQSVAAKLLDHLDQANLAKAFRGELVPQDPNDEPASVLLERICATRAEQPKNTRKGRGKTANARVAA